MYNVTPLIAKQLIELNARACHTISSDDWRLTANFCQSIQHTYFSYVHIAANLISTPLMHSAEFQRSKKDLFTDSRIFDVIPICMLLLLGGTNRLCCA